MTQSRFWCHALAAFTVAVAPGKAVLGQERPGKKLDKALQEAVAEGCPGGPRRVIISVKSGYRNGMRESLAAHGGKLKTEFKLIDAVAAEVHCDDLDDLAGLSAAISVSIDGPMDAHGSGSTKTNGRKPATLTQSEAAAALQAPTFQSMLAWPQLRAASFLGSPYTSTDSSLRSTVSALMSAGITGKAGGIGIAVIDSGIAPGPEFENRIAAFYDFTNGDIQATAPVDRFGHGTHVAGLIAGVNVGVAPGARLVGLRVLDENGRGATSDVLRAIDFAVANKDALNLHILNLSLGHPIYESAATDPLVQAVENAVRHGLIVSVSAGNYGVNRRTGEPGYAGIASPGNAPSAITSGSTNIFDTITREDDRVSAFSSRGPTWYDGFLKPDLVAPGENVLSIAAVNSRLRAIQEDRGNTGEYMRLSGTSMAAAVTTGVAALTVDINPKLTPNALKAVLQYSAIPVRTAAGTTVDALTQGAGQINGGGAISLAWVIDADAPTGAKWLKSGYDTITPTTQIGDGKYIWAQSILWGAHRLSGAALMTEQRPAWNTAIVWGDGLGDDDDIVWGNLDDDNIVWGNSFDDDDNIVWGNNIVWGSGLIGISIDDDNIVWGNLYDYSGVSGNNDDDNIVWGNNLVSTSSGKGGKR